MAKFHFLNPTDVLKPVFGSELDDSLDTSTTLMTNWPVSNGQFVDGEDDIFDNDDELQGILDADNEASEEIQVPHKVLNISFRLGFFF